MVAHRLRQLMGSIAEPDKVSLKTLRYLSKALRDLRGHLLICVDCDLGGHLRDLRGHLAICVEICICADICAICADICAICRSRLTCRSSNSRVSIRLKFLNKLANII